MRSQDLLCCEDGRHTHLELQIDLYLRKHLYRNADINPTGVPPDASRCPRSNHSIDTPVMM